MGNILVTGSSGTIGTRLCERLLAEKRSVIGVDRVPNKWQPAVNAITVQRDLLEKNALRGLPENIDAIVHLAANARVYELVEDPDRALENVVTLYNTLEFARTRGIKKFLFASSRETYGNMDAETFTEDLVRIDSCESPYTASKIAGEAFVESATRCYGIDHVIFRFSNVYGMYDDSNRVVPLFVRLARKHQPLTVFGEDKCLDFTYIDDTVHGILQTLDRFDVAKNQTFNLAYGQGVTLVHLAETVKTLLQSSSEVRLAPSRTGEVIRYVADISKARGTLGYSPKTTFEEGIRKAVEWYNAHPDA